MLAPMRCRVRGAAAAHCVFACAPLSSLGVRGWSPPPPPLRRRLSWRLLLAGANLVSGLAPRWVKAIAPKDGADGLAPRRAGLCRARRRSPSPTHTSRPICGPPTCRQAVPAEPAAAPAAAAAIMAATDVNMVIRIEEVWPSKVIESECCWLQSLFGWCVHGGLLGVRSRTAQWHSRRGSALRRASEGPVAWAGAAASPLPARLYVCARSSLSIGGTSVLGASLHCMWQCVSSMLLGVGWTAASQCQAF